MGGESKILAEYIKKGWSLTDLPCPQCGTPLLKKNDKYFCAICEREVYVVKDEKEALDVLEKDVKIKIRQRLLEELNYLYEKSDFRDARDLALLRFYLQILKELG